MPYDFDTTPERSNIMKKIKGKETRPELALRRALWAKGYRYRKNHGLLPGKPDIVITKYKIAIFVDGEFWHGFNWKEKKSKIRSNRDYWINKIEGNMNRDQKNNEALINMGYTVIRFWSNQVNKDLHSCVNYIEGLMNNK